MFDIQYLQTWAVGLLPWALGFLVLMLFDFGTGALLAWYQGEFDWEVAPRFLQTGVLYLWAWLTTEVLGAMPAVLSVDIPTYGDALAIIAPKAVYVTVVVTKYFGSIRANIQRILEIRNNVPWEPPTLSE